MTAILIFPPLGPLQETQLERDHFDFGHWNSLEFMGIASAGCAKRALLAF